jgi:hypothetical protein
MTPTNEAALARKTAPGLVAATSTPPIAGPTARAMFMETPFKAAAWGISSRSTSSGWTACHEGRSTADPRPMPNVSASTVQMPIWCISVSAPRTAAQISMNNWLASISLRRSKMSPIAPAGSPIRNVGSVVAVCTSETVSAVPPSETISHCAPTVCIHVPTFETVWAIQSARKTE